jgi:pimeloyl-ACP methyl ester carboxylesterase
VDVDQVAHLIPHLPPPVPAIDTSSEKIIEVRLGGGRRGSTYHLKLPPEYTHNRPYPVLFVLHRAGEDATQMLKKWSAAAASHGYILVAPEWGQGLANAYHYSVAEHNTVLGALRDLRKRYRVDSDRVFLFGLGEGGQMAFDVGLAHPDHFAGVMTMGAGPESFPARCWRNAQYLPIYAVNGTAAGPSTNALRDRFKDWVVRAYPAIWVEYKGRGGEWFSGEVPYLFDWMGRQRRAFPMHDLGSDGFGGNFGNEFMSLRPGASRFYWLSADAVRQATLTARVLADTNEVLIKAGGVNGLTVWITRTAKGAYNIDLNKPLTLKVGRPGAPAAQIGRAQKLMPSLEHLLEDLSRRGDRQHLCVRRIDIPLKGR